MSTAAPGFLRHLWLLWGLRLRIGQNRAPGRGRLLALLAFAASTAPGVGLAVAFYQLLGWEPVAASAMWSRFFVNLLCFVTALTWTLWPLLSAGVDDHSELSRYQAFPISSFRLLVASTLASLCEPKAVVFYAPLLGACLGFARQRGPSSWAVAAALFVLYALMTAAWSRLGLHLVLSVLRQKRSAELLGGFFLAFLIAASFIPPIPTDWLGEMGDGLAAVDAAVIAEAALALGRVPPGFLGQGLWQLSAGNLQGALWGALGMACFTALPLYLAWRLLVRLQDRAGRGGPAAEGREEHNPFARARTRLGALVAREALDLWRNPRARLLASVPFLLAILLKLISGRALLVYLLGDCADAWLMGTLCLYGAVVIASTFSQNTFAYDGHGFSVFLSAPLDLGLVMKAKNLVHGAAGVGLAVLVSVFYLLYFQQGTLLAWACAVGGVLALVPFLLAAGNLLSVFFPVKFHASLQRRDKLPFATSALGLVAAAAGALPFSLGLQLAGSGAPGPASLAVVLAGAALGWAIYFATLPLSLSLLARRRELILRAVTRE